MQGAVPHWDERMRMDERMRVIDYRMSKAIEKEAQVMCGSTDPAKMARYVCMHVYICVCMYVCICMYIECVKTWKRKRK